MDVRSLMPKGMSLDDLHARVGGSKAYLKQVLTGWEPNPGLKIVLKICRECPKIKPSMLKPELKGLK